MRRTLLAPLLAAVLAGSLAATAPTGSTPDTGRDASALPRTVVADAGDLQLVAAKAKFNSIYEHALIAEINKKRKARDLKPLKAASCADKKAERWAKFLGKNDKFYHQDLGPILRQCDATYVGEVLARGDITPKETVTAWMNSPSHKTVIMSRKPTKVGVGAFKDSEGRMVSSVVPIKP